MTQNAANPIEMQRILRGPHIYKDGGYVANPKFQPTEYPKMMMDSPRPARHDFAKTKDHTSNELAFQNALAKWEDAGNGTIVNDSDEEAAWLATRPEAAKKVQAAKAAKAASEAQSAQAKQAATRASVAQWLADNPEEAKKLLASQAKP